MTSTTVLTPTYNRCENLKNLYLSLVNQTDKNFIWLICDDGSTDETQKAVTSFQEEGVFQIKYIKKENGGKHTALNFSYQYIDTPLTFIVDSDDTLTADAIETINTTYNKCSDKSDLCAFSFLRKSPNEKCLTTPCKELYNGKKETYCECRINRNINGDMAEVWFTHCLKEYPFPQFDGEKFLGEDTVWVKMSEKYKMQFFNKAIYISQQLPDGLTQNRRMHNLNSPNGCVQRAKAFLNANIKTKYKLKYIAIYIVYGNFAKIDFKKQFSQVPTKFLYILAFIPSNILYAIWKRKYPLQ